MKVIFCSGGNDSVALMQYMIERNERDCIVLYNKTAWEMPGWMDRIKEIQIHVESIGWKFAITESEGFENMVQRKKGFPMAACNMSFCTQNLKTFPTLAWLQENDPEKRFECYAGIRREESQHRAKHPEMKCDSLYEYRLRKFPIVHMQEEERNQLVERFGFDVLPHGSMECFPCINANRRDLRLLSEYPDRIALIERLEKKMGYTIKGHPKVMFRPYRHMGAAGIREVVKWALSEHGKYNKAS